MRRFSIPQRAVWTEYQAVHLQDIFSMYPKLIVLQHTSTTFASNAAAVQVKSSIEHYDMKIAADLLKGKVVNCAGSIPDPKRDSEQKRQTSNCFYNVSIVPCARQTSQHTAHVPGCSGLAADQLEFSRGADRQVWFCSFCKALEKHKEVTPRHFWEILGPVCQWRLTLMTWKVTNTYKRLQTLGCGTCPRTQEISKWEKSTLCTTIGPESWDGGPQSPRLSWCQGTKNEILYD